MKVRDEILKNSPATEQTALLWLLDRYHINSEWSFLARAIFVGESGWKRRGWVPTDAGRKLYTLGTLGETIKRYDFVEGIPVKTPCGEWVRFSDLPKKEG